MNISFNDVIAMQQEIDDKIHTKNLLPNEYLFLPVEIPNAVTRKLGFQQNKTKEVYEVTDNAIRHFLQLSGTVMRFDYVRSMLMHDEIELLIQNLRGFDLPPIKLAQYRFYKNELIGILSDQYQNYTSLRFLSDVSQVLNNDQKWSIHDYNIDQWGTALSIYEKQSFHDQYHFGIFLRNSEVKLSSINMRFTVLTPKNQSIILNYKKVDSKATYLNQMHKGRFSTAENIQMMIEKFSEVQELLKKRIEQGYILVNVDEELKDFVQRVKLSKKRQAQVEKLFKENKISRNQFFDKLLEFAQDSTFIKESVQEYVGDRLLL